MDGTEYITLKEAGEISGYSPDYIGQLIRRGKLAGKQVYANVAWVTTKDALRGYLEDKGKSARTHEEVSVPLLESVSVSVSSKETHVEEKIEHPSSLAPQIFPEIKKWKELMRMLSLGIIVVSALFLIFLFHILLTLLDEAQERRALEHASVSSVTHTL